MGTLGSVLLIAATAICVAVILVFAISAICGAILNILNER